MGIRDFISRWKQDDGPGSLHVGDPRFDDWDFVREFEDLNSAQAWREHLSSSGFDAVLTTDWPLDRFGRGDIALRVPPEQWSDAEALLSNLDLD
jgi:hypothetical protein